MKPECMMSDSLTLYAGDRLYDHLPIYRADSIALAPAFVVTDAISYIYISLQLFRDHQVGISLWMTL